MADTLNSILQQVAQGTLAVEDAAEQIKSRSVMVELLQKVGRRIDVTVWSDDYRFVRFEVGEPDVPAGVANPTVFMSAKFTPTKRPGYYTRNDGHVLHDVIGVGKTWHEGKDALSISFAGKGSLTKRSVFGIKPGPDQYVSVLLQFVDT